MADLSAPLKAALGDRYRIERELGQGGMATVYLAEDLKHRRRVAIKVLRPEISAALGAERFLREITTTANLRHPHILPLYDSGEADGLLYYVMPYAEGESLRDRLEREKQLPLDDALRIAREVADALSHAHARDVVHRDIKPENVLLEAGHAVVADFGIARAISAAGGERLTQTGVAIGTPAYMSPEQASGSEEVDGRSDLYSLGCVLYEMLTGRPPFVGPTAESLIAQHLSADAPLVTSIRPAVPAHVAGVLARALAKSPADRFSPAAQFAEALLPLSSGETRQEVRRRPSRRALAIAGLTVVLLSAAVVFALRRGGPSVPVPGHTTRVTLEAELELDPAISPDGSMVAYAAGPLERMRVYVRQVAGGPPIALSEGLAGNHRYPRWTPDGARISFESGDGPYVVSALGGPASRLFARRSDFFGSLSWSPDATEVAYVGIDSVFVHSLETGETRALTQIYNPHSVAWSRDGEWIAFVSGNNAFVFGTRGEGGTGCERCPAVQFVNVAPSSLWLIPSQGGSPRRLTDETFMDMSPAWLPDGSLLFLSDRDGSRDIYFLRLDTDGAPLGEPVRLTTGLDAHTFTTSADGTVLAYSRFEARANVWAVDIPMSGTASMENAVQITTGNQLVEGLAVTPDGHWLAFDSDRAGNQDVYKMELPDGAPIRLTTHPAADFVFSWSWDGQYIGGHTFRNGNRDPFIVAADGTGFELLSSDPRHERYASLAPNGRIAALDAEIDGVREVMVVERDAGGTWGSPRQLTSGGGQEPVWSPDGKRIAYIGNGAVYLLDPDAAGPVMLVPAYNEGWYAVYPAWGPQGRTVYYRANDAQGRAGIWSAPAAGGPPRQLVSDDPRRTTAREEIATDGKRVYFTVPEHESDVWVMELATGR